MARHLAVKRDPHQQPHFMSSPPTLVPAQTLSVTIVDDTRREGAEFFNVMLSSPVGATLARNKTAVVTILANDVSMPHWHALCSSSSSSSSSFTRC